MQFKLVFRSPLSLGAKSSKSLVMTCSVEVSPPPANRTTTPMYIHRTAKGLRRPPPDQNFKAKNSQSTTKVTLTIHQKI